MLGRKQSSVAFNAAVTHVPAELDTISLVLTLFLGGPIQIRLRPHKASTDRIGIDAPAAWISSARSLWGSRRRGNLRASESMDLKQPAPALAW